ncbi:hypothetical protein Tco_0032061 [Tanacetum coccineum]
MAISVISASSDSSKDSVGTSVGRGILFGTIPTTILDTTLSMTPPTTHVDITPIPSISPTLPPSPDYTPASPDYSPASNTESDPFEDPLLGHIPPLPATSPFLSSTDDSLDSNIPDTPPSPTHGTPFTKTALFTQRSPVASGALRRRRVRPLPTHRLAVRHSVDYSSSDHFSLDDSSSSSSLSSSSENSLYSSTYDLFDSASSRSSSDHSLPASPSCARSSHRLCSLVPSVHRSSAAISERPSHDSSSVSPSRKRSRSLNASVLLSSPIPGALSSARADPLPLPKRIRSPKSAIDLEGCLEHSLEPYVPRETGLGVDAEDECFEQSRSRGTDLGIDIEPEIQAEIDECVAYVNALSARGIDTRVVVEAIDQEEIEANARGSIEVRVDRVTHLVIADDTSKSAQEGAVEVVYETLGDLVQRIVAIGQQSADMLGRIRELERDNRRLRDIVDVTSQRVTQSHHRELHVQRELR